MSIEMLSELGKPFPRAAIKTRSGGGGKQLSYVETHTVIRRLNEATSGQWSFSVLRLEMMGDVLTAHVSITIPGLGSREHIGVQRMQGGNSSEDLAKGSVSDALKKAATLFGVGQELYGIDYESDGDGDTASYGFAPTSIPGVRAGISRNSEMATSTNPSPQRAPYSATERRGNAPKELSGEKCASCGVEISNAVLKFSTEQYGEALCFDHQQGKPKNAMRRPSPAPVASYDAPEPDDVDLSDPFAG